MKWRKHGCIWKTDSQYNWMQSHSAVPFVIHLEADVYRIYFTARDRENRSHASFIDFDVVQCELVSGPLPKPILKPGSIGHFDDCGVTLSCYVPELDCFYYLGWNSTKTVSYNNEIGRAKFSKEGECLEKLGCRPVFGKCEDEPFTFGYPWVIYANGLYWMWYDVLLDWDNFVFELRSAISKNGVDWVKTGVSSPSLETGESGIARPCVIFEESQFKMWYSVKRSDGYRIGYATSFDGINWERLDELVGIECSDSGWDSEQIEHPLVFDHKGKRLMLYNGNGFGESGIGLAVLES